MNSTANKPLMLMMAGGTGGHIFPALAVAAALRAQHCEIAWLGSQQGLENKLVPPAGYPLHTLAVRGVRGAGLLNRLRAPFMLLASVLSAWRILRRLRPALAVGFGGYASGPGALAARLSGVPLLIHEQNARPGLTNRLLAPLATRVVQGFPGAFSGRADTLGNPVRDVITTLAAPEKRYAQRRGPLHILIIGGSQGALALNTVLPAALATAFADKACVVTHQTGAGRLGEAQQHWQTLSVAVNCVEFIDDMAAALADADLLICRSGASTVSEVAAAGVAALFIPLPGAVDDHQTWNARWLVDQQAALLLPQAQLSAQALVTCLQHYRSREALQQMAMRARACALPDSAEAVAHLCLEVARG